MKDASTGQPVEGATITVLHHPASTVTDEWGRFSLRSKSAIDSIAISFIGYITQVLAVHDHQPVTVLLRLSRTTLSGVEVTATQQERPSNVIGQQELNRYSGLSLQDALNSVPGVNMQARSPWGGQHIVIRGYYPSVDNGRNNSQNFNGLGYQLTLNNIPVTDATGLTIMDDIDFATLGKVEVIKGPSPLHGGYIAGAVNLFGATPAAGQTILHERIIAGSNGLFRNDIGLQTSNGKADLSVNYGRQGYDGFRPHSASHKDYASIAANFAVSEKQSVSVYFSYNHSREDLAGEMDSADFYNRLVKSNSVYLANNSHVNIESFRAGITNKYRLGSGFANETTLFTTGAALNQYFAHGFSKNMNLGFGGRTAFTLDAASDRLAVNGVLGLSFIKTAQNTQGNFVPPFVSPPFTPATVPDIRSDAQNYAMNYAMFTQWKFSLPSGISLTAGGSINFQEFGTQNLISNNLIYLDNPYKVKAFRPTFNPVVSVEKSIGDPVSLYAGMSTGYAPPVLAQMTGSDGKVNTALKPERAIQFEAGARGRLARNNAFSYQLAIFDMEIRDRLIQQNANGISFYTNASRQRNLGAELFVAYTMMNGKKAFISLVKPWISYTWSHFSYIDFRNYAQSRSTGGDSLVADYSGNRVAGVSPNTFNAGVDLVTSAGLYMNATFRYVDRVFFTFDNRNEMRSYNTLQARLGYKAQLGGRFTLDAFAGADNLLGNTWYSFVFIGQQIRELAQASDPNIQGGGGDGYIIPAPYKASFYGGVSLKVSL